MDLKKKKKIFQSDVTQLNSGLGLVHVEDQTLIHLERLAQAKR